MHRFQIIDCFGDCITRRMFAMKKLILLVCLFLNGCFYQTVSAWDIERAIAKCGSLENVVAISAHFVGDETVICKPNDVSKYL